jgi:hypothetical protein
MVAVRGSWTFVAHPVAGVHLIPAEWLEARRASGFREATAAEVARWYDERGLEPPAGVLTLVEQREPADDQPRRAFGLLPEEVPASITAALGLTP